MITLNDGQYRVYKEALQWFRSSGDQVFEIDGLAGQGKSVLMHEILRGLGLSSTQYMAMAYTGQAAIVMRTKGFHNAKSIHSSLYEVVEFIDYDDINTVFNKPKKKSIFKKKDLLDPNIKLLFIDEAYMVPSRMVSDILSFGIKVIACGDSHQLPPINDNPAFISDPNRCHHLTEFMRQAKDDPIIYIADRIIHNEPIHNGIYGDSVLVANIEDFRPEMIGYADVMICGTNRTRNVLNNTTRNLLGYSDNIFPRAGERLICRNNNWNVSLEGIALANGLCGYCCKPADPMSTTSTTFGINFTPDIVNGYFDDVRINIEYFLADYEKRMELKETSRKYGLDGELFEYAYALTTHLSQGAEYTKGLFIDEFLRPQIQRQLEYTAVTRFKKSCIILHSNPSSLRKTLY